MLNIRWSKNEAGRPVATWVDRGHDSPVIPLAACAAVAAARPGPGFPAAADLDLRKVA